VISTLNGLTENFILQAINVLRRMWFQNSQIVGKLWFRNKNFHLQYIFFKSFWKSTGWQIRFCLSSSLDIGTDLCLSFCSSVFLTVIPSMCWRLLQPVYTKMFFQSRSQSVSLFVCQYVCSIYERYLCVKIRLPFFLHNLTETLGTINYSKIRNPNFS
jgi:hypothetical protein